MLSTQSEGTTLTHAEPAHHLVRLLGWCGHAVRNSIQPPMRPLADSNGGGTSLLTYVIMTDQIRSSDVEGNIGVGFILTGAAEKDGVQYVRIYPGKSVYRHIRYVRGVRLLARTWMRIYSHLAVLWSADNIQRLITFGSVNE